VRRFRGQFVREPPLCWCHFCRRVLRPARFESLVKQLLWHVDRRQSDKCLRAMGRKSLRDLLVVDGEGPENRTARYAAIAEIGRFHGLGVSIGNVPDLPASSCLLGKVLPRESEEFVAVTEDEIFRKQIPTDLHHPDQRGRG